MSTRGAQSSGLGPMVDVTALKVNQTLIVGLVAVAFVLGTGAGGPWLVAAVAASLAIGAALPGYGPFQLLYRRVLRPAGVVRPRLLPDDPAPHRFAQAVGAIVSGVAAIALLAGLTWVGWTLAWVVAALALVNLVFGFCAGCFIYFHLRRQRRLSKGAA